MLLMLNNPEYFQRYNLAPSQEERYGEERLRKYYAAGSVNIKFGCNSSLITFHLIYNMTVEEPKCPVEHKESHPMLNPHIKTAGQVTEEAKCPVENKESHPMLNPNNQMPLNPEQAHSTLATDRATSSIPMGEKAGNWIYPSEAMFFNAMKRKNWDPQESDMSSIIPIHNAVNEKCWEEILKWY